MASGTLARRYALALISLAQKENLLGVLSKDLEIFCATWNEGNGLLSGAMQNPGISVHERQSVLKAILEKLSLHTYINNFVQLLLEKNRLSLLLSIQEAYEEMADELSGKVRARVTTATELDLGDQDSIRQTLAKSARVFTSKMLAIAWRLNITRSLHETYFSDRTYYSLNVLGKR